MFKFTLFLFYIVSLALFFGKYNSISTFFNGGKKAEMFQTYNIFNHIAFTVFCLSFIFYMIWFPLFILNLN